MNNSLRTGIFVFSMSAACVAPCAAWGEVGHRVVARIAATLLAPAARAKVATIPEVDDTKTAVADALADAAEWPDAVARTQIQAVCCLARHRPWAEARRCQRRRTERMTTPSPLSAKPN